MGSKSTFAVPPARPPARKGLPLECVTSALAAERQTTPTKSSHLDLTGGSDTAIAFRTHSTHGVLTFRSPAFTLVRVMGPRLTVHGRVTGRGRYRCGMSA